MALNERKMKTLFTLKGAIGDVSRIKDCSAHFPTHYIPDIGKQRKS